MASPEEIVGDRFDVRQMVTGVMVVENLFALPGLGTMLVTDVGNRDLMAVQSELFLLAAFFLLLGLVVDVVHRALDPRLKDAGLVSGGGACMMKQSAEKTTSKNAVKTVIPSIWRTAGGKYSLIMLAIWLVVSAIFAGVDAIFAA